MMAVPGGLTTSTRLSLRNNAKPGQSPGDAVIGCQWRVSVCVERLKPRSWRSKRFQLERLVPRHAESPTAKTKVPAYLDYASAKLQLGV